MCRQTHREEDHRMKEAETGVAPDKPSKTIAGHDQNPEEARLQRAVPC